jgi:hypothetical protein
MSEGIRRAVAGSALPGAAAGRLAAFAITLDQGPRAHVAHLAELGSEVIAAEQENVGGGCGIRHGVFSLTVFYAVRKEKSRPPINEPAIP